MNARQAAGSTTRAGPCDGWDLDQWGDAADEQHYERGVEVVIAELTIRPGEGWGPAR